MIVLSALYLVAAQVSTCPEGYFAERDECVPCSVGRYRNDTEETVTCRLRLDSNTVVTNNGIKYDGAPVTFTPVSETDVSPFAWGRLGVQECPLKYHPIMTAADCEQAATSLSGTVPPGDPLSYLTPATSSWGSHDIVYQGERGSEESAAVVGCYYDAGAAGVYLDKVAGTALTHQHDAVLCARLKLVTFEFEPKTDATVTVQVQHIVDSSNYCGSAAVSMRCSSSITESSYDALYMSQETCSSNRPLCKSASGWWAGNIEKDVVITCAPIPAYSEEPRRCQLCSGGLYQDVEAQTNCKGTPCEPGTFAHLVPQTQPVVCEPCLSGQFATTSGAVSCQGNACQPGTYGQLGMSTHNDCTVCNAGTYQIDAGQDHCIECPNGMFQDNSGQTQCKPTTTTCGAGTFINTDNKVSGNCEPCTDLNCCQEAMGSTLCAPCAQGQWSMRPDASNYCHGHKWAVSCNADEYKPTVSTITPLTALSNERCMAKIDTLSSAEWVDFQNQKLTILASEESVASMITASGSCSTSAPAVQQVVEYDVTAEVCAERVRAYGNYRTMIHSPSGATQPLNQVSYTDTPYKVSTASTYSVCCQMCRLTPGCRIFTHIGTTNECRMFVRASTISYQLDAVSGTTQTCELSTGRGGCYASSTNVSTYDSGIAKVEPISVNCETQDIGSQTYCKPGTVSVLTDHSVDGVEADVVVQLEQNEPFYADNCVKMTIDSQVSEAQGDYIQDAFLRRWCHALNGCSTSLEYANAGLQEGSKTVSGDAQSKYDQCFKACESGSCFTVQFKTQTQAPGAKVRLVGYKDEFLPEECLVGDCSVHLCDTTNIVLQAVSGGRWSFSILTNNVKIWDGTTDTYDGQPALRPSMTCLSAANQLYLATSEGSCQHTTITATADGFLDQKTQCFKSSVSGDTCTYQYVVNYLQPVGWHIEAHDLSLNIMSSDWIVSQVGSAFRATCKQYKQPYVSTVPIPASEGAEKSTECMQFVTENTVFTATDYVSIASCTSQVYCVDDSTVMCQCGKPEGSICTMERNAHPIQNTQFNSITTNLFRGTVSFAIDIDSVRVVQYNTANCFSVLSPKRLFEKSPLWSQTQHNTIWATVQQPRKLVTSAFLQDGVQLSVQLTDAGYMLTYDNAHETEYATCLYNETTDQCNGAYLASSLQAGVGEYIIDSNGNLMFSADTPVNQHRRDPDALLTASFNYLRACPLLDQVCLTCTEGYTCNGENRVTCPVGTEATNGLCEQCAIGKKGVSDESTGAAKCVDCEPGKYQNTTGQLECKDCSAGQFQSNPGNDTCTQCNYGQSASSEGQVECDECVPGKYSFATGQSECTPCEPGRYTEADGQVECTPCLPGQYQDTEGNIACLGTVCEPGSFAASGAVAPVQCALCALDKFQDNAAQESCVDCGSGSVALSLGSTACTPCPQHFFKKSMINLNFVRETSCVICPLGSFTKDTGNSECTLCPAGKYGIYHADRCEYCPAGQFSKPELYPGGRCTNCPDGRTRAKRLDTEGCTPCNPGTYKVSHAMCNACPAGKYSFGGTNNCTNITKTNCGSLNKTNQRGATNDTEADACVGCGAGRFGSNGTCVLCPAGKFNDEVNAQCTNEASCCEPIKCAHGQAALSPGATSPIEACTTCPAHTRAVNNTCLPFSENVSASEYIAARYPCWSPLLSDLLPGTQTVMLCPCNSFGEAMLGPDNGVSFIDTMSRHFFPGEDHMHSLTFQNVFAFEEQFEGCQEDTFDYSLTSVTTNPRIYFNVKPFCSLFHALNSGTTQRSGYNVVDSPLAVIEAQDDAMCWSVLTNYIRAEKQRRVQRLSPVRAISTPDTSGAFSRNQCTSPPCSRTVIPMVAVKPVNKTQAVVDELVDSKRCVAPIAGDLECIDNCAKHIGYEKNDMCILIPENTECPERTQLCFVGKLGNGRHLSSNTKVWFEHDFKCKHHSLESNVRAICAKEPACTAYVLSQYSACYLLRNDTATVSSQYTLSYDKLYAKRNALHPVGMRLRTHLLQSNGTHVSKQANNVDCLLACNANPQCTGWQYEFDFQRCTHSLARASRVIHQAAADNTCCTQTLKDRVIKLWTDDATQRGVAQTDTLQDYADSIGHIVEQVDGTVDSLPMWDHHKCCDTDAKRSTQFCRLMSGKAAIAVDPRQKCPDGFPARCIDKLQVTNDEVDLRFDNIVASELPNGCGKATTKSTSVELVPILNDDNVFMARYADASIHYDTQHVISRTSTVTFEACGDLCISNSACKAILFERGPLNCTTLTTTAPVQTFTGIEDSKHWVAALGTDVGVKSVAADGDVTLRRSEHAVGTHQQDFDVQIPVTWTMRKQPVAYCMNACMGLKWCTGFSSPGQTCQFYAGTHTTNVPAFNFFHLLRIVHRATCSSDLDARFTEQKYMMARYRSDWTTMNEENIYVTNAVTADVAYMWFDMQQCAFVSPDF